MVRIERPYLTAILTVATALDCLEPTARNNIHAKTLPDRIPPDFARVLTILQFELRTIHDLTILSDFDGKTLCRILMPMELTIRMIHRKLLVIRIVVSSTCVELKDACIGIGILDGNAKRFVLSVLTFAI